MVTCDTAELLELCILSGGIVSERRDMKREELRRTGNDQSTRRVEDEAGKIDLYETDVERASTAYYERRRIMWIKFNQGDWWIAVAVYLVFSSIAFVVL